jgi:competence protein ComEC
MVNLRENPSFLILGFLILLNLLAWIAVYEFSAQGLEVIFFDVGQGDAIFIETPQKHQILIDGGPDSVILEKLGKIMPFWDRTIDLIILTHPEKDHMTGLLEVLKRYKVENILWTGIVRNTFEYEEWLKLIKKEKANVFIAKEGQKVNAGKVILNVLYPFDNLTGQEFENSNDTSIVNRLTFGQNSFLFTGDISQAVEKELVTHSSQFLKANVLKVAHHGSKTSTAAEFVATVLPEVSVISSGKNNRYGHPHQEVLETLANYGIMVLRTDELGDITISSDGSKLFVKYFKK